MLSVVFVYCYAECRYAECRYAECRYAECRGAVYSSLLMKLLQRSALWSPMKMLKTN